MTIVLEKEMELSYLESGDSVLGLSYCKGC